MPQRNFCSDARSVARRRHRFAIATAGLATGALLLLPSVDHALAGPSMDRGEAAVGQVARRAAPSMKASAPVAPVVAGEEAVVEIPSLKLSLPVVRGGQRVIDKGVAAHYSETGRRPVVDPGRPGTYLAGGPRLDARLAVRIIARHRRRRSGAYQDARRRYLHLHHHVARTGRIHDHRGDRLRARHDYAAHPASDVPRRLPSTARAWRARV